MGLVNNRSLRESFYTPLASRLKSAGLPVDATTANRYVRAWLAEVANVREHATLKRRPQDLWQEELAMLTPLPAEYRPAGMPHIEDRPVPVESLQHPLSVYGELLEVAP